MTYSTDDAVKNLLGPIATKLPAWVIVTDYRTTAYAETLDVLAGVYGNAIPAFTGAGLAVVALAESRFAAAGILESIRVLTGDDTDAPARLRAEARSSLVDGVPGYPVGAAGTDTDGNPDTPDVYGTPSPRVSSFTPLSAFPDPYAAARDGSRFQ